MAQHVVQGTVFIFIYLFIYSFAFIILQLVVQGTVFISIYLFTYLYIATRCKRKHFFVLIYLLAFMVQPGCTVSWYVCTYMLLYILLTYNARMCVIINMSLYSQYRRRTYELFDRRFERKKSDV